MIAAGLAAFACLWMNASQKVQGWGSEAGQDDGKLAQLNVSAMPDQTKLPGQFDLRMYKPYVTVPDQGTFGTCWAFASLKAIESSVDHGPELSADHMSLRNSFGLGQDDGGDYSMASAYLLAWQGPVTEADDPYGDGRSPEHAEPVYHVQEIQILDKKDFGAIKRAVYEIGGVQSAFYMPQTAGAERNRYYNEETCSFYYNGTMEPNHDIVIVGWDDSYPKENFVQQPTSDGAFLCMNTWGAQFGDGGYFYISYEDSRIGDSCVAYTGVESVGNYDHIYQTDLCGWTGQMGYGTEDAWFANVYESEEKLELAAVGFYATVPETEYRVYVARLSSSGEMSAEEQMKKGLIERFLAAEGGVSCSGYYTIPLENPLTVEPGERFAVLVEIHSPGAVEPIAIEYQTGSRTSKVDIEDGEGYISSDGVNWERTETGHQCNVCLKAYTNVK